MNRVVAIVALLVAALAGCTSSPEDSPASSIGQQAAPTSATATPVLACPTPAEGVPALRVVGREVTLRDRPGKLDDGTVVLGVIPKGQVVELKAVGEGPWRHVACGEQVGWALADNSQGGADRRVWLEPVD